MTLKPQDLLVVLKLLASGMPGSFALLGRELGISASESNLAFHRARNAGLIHPMTQSPVRSAVSEFMIHGIKYVFPVQAGRRTRGLPTGYAAPPLSDSFSVPADDPDLPVWPDSQGTTSGVEISPLFPSVVVAARADSQLYEWLVLADTMRGVGRARERELAIKLIRQRLDTHESR